LDAGFRRATPPALPSLENDPAVASLIREEIATKGPITFARFMELALYAPDVGYYTSPRARVGRGGDFLTAPETHPIFGAALARQVADVWRLVGEPAPFHVREYGAGNGTLATAILDTLATDEPALAAALRYEAVEINPQRRAEAAARARGSLEDPATTGHHVAGIIALSPEEAAARPPVAAGMVLANEFLDAFPVHRLVQTADGLREIRITASARGQAFTEAIGAPSTPAFAARLAAEGVTLATDQRVEIALGIDAWLAEVAAWLGRGVAIVIDYGANARDLYGPRRAAGTLMGYLDQQALDDPLAAVGRQDLTAHVDFTAVERAAESVGLEVVGRATQSEFLVNLGLQDLLARARSDPGQTMADYLALRSGIVRLLDPRHTGGFRVVALGRGLNRGSDDARAAVARLAGFGAGHPSID